MFRTITLSVALTLLLTSIIISCQNNPTSPALNPDTTQPALRDVSANPHTCLGYYVLSIDTVSGTPTILPARTTDWHINVTGILNTTMGISAVGVPGESDIANGLVVMDITLTHPFESKPQLSGFDVKGILITPGTLQINPSLEPDLVFAGPGETQLENADGCSRWWNPTEFTQPGMFGYTQGNLANAGAAALTATINPYKYFADALNPIDSIGTVHDTDLDHDEGRGVFRAGESNTRRYRIRFPMNPGPVVVYGYAVDASWLPPVPNPPTEIPDDFPFSANCPEAYHVSLTPGVDTLYFDTESGASGGVLRLQVSVYDWQGRNNDDISAEVGEVLVYAPDLFPDVLSAPFVEEKYKSAKYALDLTGLALPKHAGPTLLAVGVTIAGATTYDQGVAPAPSETLCAWETLMLNVADFDCSPDANNDWSEATELEIDDQFVNKVCLPDDYRDFYTFSVPPGTVLSGEISLYCDPVPTKLTAYDEDQNVVNEADISGGLATLTMNAIPPGKYFIRVWTSNDTQVSPYFLELDCEYTIVIPSDMSDVTPNNLFMRANRVWTYDHYAILKGLGHWVYDIADPANPAFVSGETRPENWTATAGDFHYPYLYYEPAIFGPGDSRIRMIDFTSLSSPSHHPDVLTLAGDTGAICMNSTTLCIGLNDPGGNTVQFYDYSSYPLNPVNVGHVDVPEDIMGLALVDPEGSNTQLVVASETKIYTYGIEDPDSAIVLGYDDIYSGYTYNDMVVVGNYIIVADNFAASGYLDTFETSPAGPTYVYGLNISAIPEAVWFNDPYVYAACGNAGVVTADYTDPLHPTIESTVPSLAFAEKIAVSDDTLCLIPNLSSLQTFDLATPANPVAAGRLSVVNYPTSDIFFRDNFMLVADNTRPSSLKVIDISDPSNAFIYSEAETVQPTGAMGMYGNLIAVVINNVWVMLLDATDLANITLASIYPQPETIDGVYLFEDCLYYTFTSAPTYYIVTVDVSDPGSPTDVTNVSFADTGYNSICFYEDVMFVTSDAGVRIYNITTPTMPFYVDLIPTAASVTRIEILDHWLYAYMSDSQIVQSYDITNPIAPVLTGSGATGTSSSQNMALDGQFAYFSGSDPHIYALWTWPPDTIGPSWDAYPDPYAGYGLAANDGYLYKTTLGTGIRIFDLY